MSKEHSESDVDHGNNLNANGDAGDLDSQEVRANLRALARRRALLRDERWRMLAQGTATPKVIERLEEEAKTSEDAQALLEIARPKMVKKPSHPPRKLAQRVGAALLMAASFGGIWWVANSRTSNPIAALPVPVYQLSVEGGTAKTLGAKEPQLVRLPFGSDAIMELTLAPAPTTRVSLYGPLRAQAFLARFGAVLPLEMKLAVNPAGEVVVKGTRAELFPHVSNGVYELLLVIGPESEISPDPHQLLEHLDKKERTISISRATVQLDGENAEPQNPSILDVSFTGCAEVLGSGGDEPWRPVCLTIGTKPNPIRLYVKADATAAVTSSSISKGLELATAPAGTFVDIEPTSSTDRIRIEATTKDRKAQFELKFRNEQQDPLHDVQEKKKINRGDAFAAALNLFNTSSDASMRARAAGFMGRMRMGEGQYSDAVKYLQEALALNRQTGRLSGELSDGVALSEIHVMHQHDLDQGRKVLDSLIPVAAYAPEALVKLPYYGANVAAQSGDLRQALRLYDETLTVGAARGFVRIQEDAKFALAEIFVKLGRIKDARKLQAEFLKAAKETELSGCEATDTYNQAGWVEYLASYAPDEGVHALKKAKSLFDEGLAHECKNGFTLANVYTNLALVALKNGKMEEVREPLTKARQASPKPGPYLEDWWVLVESRMLIGEGKKEPRKAKQALEMLEKLLEHARDAEVRLDAWLSRAEAYDVLGDKAAREAYRAADVDALRYALGVELTTGAGAFLAVHGRSTERRIDYLLRLAEKEPRQATEALTEAVDAARRSRLRMLASLSGRVAIDDSLKTRRKALVETVDGLNKLIETAPTNTEQHRKQQEKINREFARLLESIGISPDAPLSQAGKGELILVYHPIGDGYVGFALDDAGQIVAQRLDISPDMRLPPEEIAARVLNPFRTKIEGAKRLRLAPHGATLARVDFHALPWKEGKLIHALPVAYAVDLHPASKLEKSLENGQSPTALMLMSDAAKSLPGASREAEEIARVLQEQRGFNVRKQTATTAQNAQDLQSELSRANVQLFHFVGHGHFQSLAGNSQGAIYRPDLDGWDSGVRLGNGALFSPRQVMQLERVPPIVLMSACEVGNMVDEANGLSFGLPQAFIAKGAQAVIAATVPLVAGTEDKQGFHEKLMKQLVTSKFFPSDLPAALRDAQLALSFEDEWAAFRVFVP